jgi:hypothetical protein
MDFIKKNIVSICLFLLTAIGGLVWSFIQKGAEAEFNEKVEQVLTNKIQSRDFMNDVMETDYMKEYKVIQQRRMVTVMLNSNDSSRVKFSAKLSAKTGLTVEALVDSIAARVHEKQLGEKEIVELIRKYNRRMISL